MTVLGLSCENLDEPMIGRLMGVARAFDRVTRVEYGTAPYVITVKIDVSYLEPHQVRGHVDTTLLHLFRAFERQLVASQPTDQPEATLATASNGAGRTKKGYVNRTGGGRMRTSRR